MSIMVGDYIAVTEREVCIGALLKICPLKKRTPGIYSSLSTRLLPTLTRTGVVLGGLIESTILHRGGSLRARANQVFCTLPTI